MQCCTVLPFPKQTFRSEVRLCLAREKGRMKSDTLHSLPNDKVLDWSKLKQIADDILKCI